MPRLLRVARSGTLLRMAEMPTGAVTFLFTDIEGSTRLVKQLREGYGEVLREHQRLLRSAFDAHGGYEVDTQGDSFFVAFASARDALLAAVEGQLELSSHRWPEGVAIKVRMGLHTGQAVASGDRYTGLAVHRAARIGAAAHGGQILVSQATQTLLEDEEEDLHVFLRDLGEQQLKDLDRPVRLYQAGADGLPASFPPLRSSAELAQAAEVALHPVPLWRRPVALGAAALTVVAVLAVVILAMRGSGGGLGSVQPNHVGVIDPKTNDIVDEIAVGLRPGPVAAGDGLVWVGNLQDRNLTKIDASERAAVGTISLENRTPTAIAVGADGVWVAHGLLGEVTRVDPQFGSLTRIPVAGTAFGSPEGGVAIDGRSIWVVFGDSTLARIDGAANRVAGKGLAGTQPSGVAVGSGSVWVANEGDANVLRFNPDTFEAGPVRTPISVGRRPSAIAFGEDALWVPNAADGTVNRIDRLSGSTRTITVGKEPAAVVVGAGAVWVANAGDGTISRIDPASNTVTRTIHIGNAPSGLSIADGLLWVAVREA
jgi:YVTN family beta-propeller protein